MTKIVYVPKKFQSFQEELIHYADQVITSYARQGYDLTLRQLYYQFVAHDWLPERWRDPYTHSKNNEKAYDKLGVLVSNARLAGRLDWENLVDRVRVLDKRSQWDNPEDIIDSAARGYHTDWWATQENYAEVWVEKDALSGVVEIPARQLDVPILAARGYMSQSAMWQAAQRFIRRNKEGQHVNVIYLGDHDPSGLDMSRDIRDRLNTFRVRDFEVRRVALNWDQVQEYDPPPSPAKISDSRAQAYIEEFGDDSWELDALPPEKIAELVKDEIEFILDPDQFDEAKAQEERERRVLLDIKENYDDIAQMMSERN